MNTNPHRPQHNTKSINFYQINLKTYTDTHNHIHEDLSLFTFPLSVIDNIAINSLAPDTISDFTFLNTEFLR